MILDPGLPVEYAVTMQLTNDKLAQDVETILENQQIIMQQLEDFRTTLDKFMPTLERFSNGGLLGMLGGGKRA